MIRLILCGKLDPLCLDRTPAAYEVSRAALSYLLDMDLAGSSMHVILGDSSGYSLALRPDSEHNAVMMKYYERNSLRASPK